MSAGRACDQCRRRKVRCLPAEALNSLVCQNCASATLECTYKTVPLKKGPKGSKASVLHELKQPRKSPISQSAVDEAIDTFFSKLYHVLPIVNRATLQTDVNAEQADVERYCLMLSLCCMVATQVLDRPADELIRVTLRTRQTLDYVESPTLCSVHISFFLFATFFGRNIHNTAWVYLREAITFAQLIGLDNEASYSNLTSRVEIEFRRRTFWVLYVTERAYAIQRHHSLSMQPSIELPLIQDPCTMDDLTGFHYMVKLWSEIDTDFLTLWNDSRQEISAEYMIHLHHRVQNALPNDLASIPAVQRVDILVSQQWLRVILWQLSTSRMLLSSTAQAACLQFTYPVTICRDMLSVAAGTSHEVLRVHGLGLVEKLFEVASTLVDVIVCDLQLLQQNQSNAAPLYLAQLLTLMQDLRHGKNPWVDILQVKIAQSLPNFDVARSGTWSNEVSTPIKMEPSQPGLSPLSTVENGLEWPSARSKRV